MELVPKSSLLDCKTDQTKLEELAANVTEHGFSKATLQYLRVMSIALVHSVHCLCQCHSLSLKPVIFVLVYFLVLIFMYLFLLPVTFPLRISAFQNL